MSNVQSFQSAEELVFDHLRTAILGGRFLPDTALNQEEIARALNVSRIPVRDALRRLHSVGLVNILPNKRAVVPSFTPHEILELFEMRAVLEGLLARYAVGNLRSADFSELHGMAAMMSSVTDLDAYLVRHEAFHDLIASRARLPRVRREAAQLRDIIGPYIRIHGIAQHGPELAQDWHESLLTVLKKGSAVAAEKALSGHVRFAGQQLVKAVEDLTVPDQPEVVRHEARSGKTRHSQKSSRADV